MKAVENQSNFRFAGYDTVELAKAYGTPLYVLSEEKIRERCREIKESFLKRHNHTWAAYASKAFLTMAMCKIIESEDLGLDVVSGGELYIALKSDFPMERVMFHGNNKSDDELQMAIEHHVGRIVVDHLDEIDRIQAIAARCHKTVKILIRVAPGVAGKTHKYITTGQKDSKFGMPLDEQIMNEAVSKAMHARHIQLMGFHFHIGSNLFEREDYILAIKFVMNLFKRLKDDFGLIVQELNTGGGFGIRHTKEDQVKPLAYFTDAIMEAIHYYGAKYRLSIPRLIIEPGRWIVGEAGITLYTIGAIKKIPNIRTYISVDGGLPDNPRPALYGAKYHGVVANKQDEPLEATVTVAGKCCESGDILMWDLQVPGIEVGDIFAVLSTGAYNFSMASNYNRLPRPAVLLLGKEPHVIVQRESYETLIEREQIPGYLLQKKYPLKSYAF